MCRTPGGKGLNVVAARSSAQVGMMYKLSPRHRRRDERGQRDRFVATVIKSKRKGKVLIDYLRNGGGSAAVAPYSTRARLGAALSMSLEWAELSLAIGPAYFTVTNAHPRLAALDADPWEDFRKAAAPLAVGKWLKRAV